MKTCSQCNVHYPDALEFCPRDGNKLPPPPGGTQALYDPLLGATIDGRYIIESLLGQGGMGFVYAARHAIIDKRVAIKVLRKEAAQDESSAQRFIVEAKAASKIGHQNIVDITDFGVLPPTNGMGAGNAYFVMEFLDGPTLANIQVEIGHFDPLRAIAVSIQIARGLHAAHGKGIIHRDLKPENIFVLSRDGQNDVIKIVDFGIAKDKAYNRKLTQVGMVLGTPEYMSPEQATGQPTDHRVDMYALGCILYEMLVGDVPFKGETSTKTLTSHVFDPVSPPSARRPDLNVPPALEAVVMKTLSKKPAERYADMRELIVELERVEGDLRAGRLGPAQPREAPPAGVTELTSPISDDDLKPPRSELPLYLGIAAVAVVLIGMTVAAVSHGGSGNKPPVAVTAPPVTAPATPAAGTMPPPGTTTTATAPSGLAAEPQVEIVIRTAPPGSDVFDGAERLGLSPLTLKRPHANAPVTFTIKHGGFKDASRDVLPDRDREVEVVLVARPKAVAAAHRPAAPPPSNPSAPHPAPKRVSDLRNPFE